MCSYSFLCSFRNHYPLLRGSCRQMLRIPLEGLQVLLGPFFRFFFFWIFHIQVPLRDL